MEGIVYKYHRNNEFLENLIKDKSIWHSTANSFNDPFEFKSSLVENVDRDDVKNWLNSGRKKLEEDQLNQITDYWLGRKVDMAKMLTEKINEKLSTGGVSCFSWRHDNLLMWAHYADNHKGVCLEYNIAYSPDFFKDLLPVRYTDDYPNIDYIKNGSKAITEIITTKSTHWSYEEEYRSCKRESGLHSFDIKSLRSIIFGCRCSKEEILRIIAFVKALGSDYDHINFVQTFPKSNSFGLDFKYLQLNNLDQTEFPTVQ